MIYLNQKTSLVKVLQEDEALASHFDLSDYDTVSRNLKELTQKQYLYILFLITNKKRFKLNQMMVDLGFERI